MAYKKKSSKLDTGELVGTELAAVFDKIAMFFMKAGVSKAVLRKQLALSISKAGHQDLPMRFVSNSNGPEFIRAFDRWLTHPEYANAAGKPRALHAAGRLSLTSLLRESGYKDDVGDALETLISQGAIRKNSDGTYSAPNKFFNWRRDGQVAYAPHAQFLTNAVAASTIAIGSDENDHRLFWRTSTSDRIPAKLIDSYLQYMRQTTDTHLRQLEDWFGQHEARTTIKKEPKTVIGFGFFPFVQTLQVGKPPSKTRKGVGKKSQLKAQ